MYLGDINLGDTIDFKFTTRRFSTGAPFTLAGTPSVAAYPDNSTTEVTAGITLTVDFDSRTGCHNVRIVATSGNGYQTGTNYAVVITAGTVDSVSVVGEVVAHFSIEKRSPLRPTTAGRTLDVSTGGEAGLDWANIGSPTTAQTLSGTSTKALEPTTAGRTLDVSTGGEAGIDWANIGSPTTAQTLSGTTVKTATDVETDTQDIQSRLPAALTIDGNIKADTLRVGGTLQTAGDIIGDTNDIQARLPAALVSGRIDASVGAMAANTITATAIATGAIDADAIADDAIDAGAIANGAIDAATFASGALDAVWSTAARVLTAGTNIVLAKGVGVTGFNDLSQADVRTAVGLASANLDTQLGDLPTGVENADALLGRNIAGGSSSGRIVTDALRALRNRVVVDGTTVTVYQEDDSATAWTGTATRDATLDALKEINPA